MNTYKIVLLGQFNSGKSSITHQYIYNQFDQSIATTIGASFFSKKLKTSKGEIILQIWDCGSHHSYDTLMPMYFKNAHLILIIYDVTSRHSFTQVNHYLEKIRSHVDNVKIILVGNKLDLEEQRDVTPEEGQSFAKEQELLFVECSAAKNINIDTLFKLVIDELEHVKPVNFHAINLDKLPEQSKCCY